MVPPASTASAWDLPLTWTALDAVFPGGGKKSGFAYFFRADEYCRFDWTTNKRSPGYPKKIAAEWKTSPPFNVNFDGVIIGHAANFGTKAYLFKTLSATVDNNTGNPVAVGALNSHPVCRSWLCSLRLQWGDHRVRRDQSGRNGRQLEWFISVARKRNGDRLL